MERRLQGANDIFVGWTLMGKQLHTSGHTDLGVEEMEHFGGPRLLSFTGEWLVCFSPCLQSQHCEERHCFP